MAINMWLSNLSPVRCLWHTVRFLQPAQVYNQIRRRVLPPRLIRSLTVYPDARPIPLLPGITSSQKYLGGGRFIFLNKEANLGKEIDWQAFALPRLWQYNLHYFDYLNQQDMDLTLGLSLISHWIHNSPVRPNSTGWEPYPISLRIVNWLKFFSRFSDIPEEAKASLLLQTINLKRQIEHHIGGNHLWANGKALWFAGIFLKKPEFAEVGKKIIFKEIDRQFLPDGGHFELSPMYHAILTEDLLDLINLCKNSAQPKNEQNLSILKIKASRAMGWLRALVDDKGLFPLLNDAALGVAASYAELLEYAHRLGVNSRLGEVGTVGLGPWSGKNLSGYWLLNNGPFRVIWDTAPLGPDHLLGHTHCDMLSVLLDFEGQNIWTDTGVSGYEEGEQRQYERGTSAHNTVVLDGLEQAELWKSFRVGRRGYPNNFSREGQTLRCSHTGFEIWQSGLSHERMLSFFDAGFELVDGVKGPGHHRFKAFFHFAPEVCLEPYGEGSYLINKRLLLKVWGAEPMITTSAYCPEFGKVLERPCLTLNGEFRQQHFFGLKCTFFS